jgi:hypothetical protein
VEKIHVDLLPEIYRCPDGWTPQRRPRFRDPFKEPISGVAAGSDGGSL